MICPASALAPTRRMRGPARAGASVLGVRCASARAGLCGRFCGALAASARAKWALSSSGYARKQVWPRARLAMLACGVVARPRWLDVLLAFLGSWAGNSSCVFAGTVLPARKGGEKWRARALQSTSQVHATERSARDAWRAVRRTNSGRRSIRQWSDRLRVLLFSRARATTLVARAWRREPALARYRSAAHSPHAQDTLLLSRRRS